MYSKIILFILLPFLGFSQAPQKINFQSILRNTNGEIVANKSVSLKISILSGSISGSSVYSETHAKTTDASGLISLQIGKGTVLSGVFANIGWGNASHFIKLEADFSGGSNYVVLGTQELMSVPYALYASKTDTSSLNLVNRFSYLQNQVELLSSYTSLLASGLVDIDGNNYPVVKIGNQIWMKENLRVTKYRDGTVIPLDESGGSNGNGIGQTWSYRTTGARTVNGHNISNLATYGYLYNWHAATDIKGLCPNGWHVPSDAEWTNLTNYLGGESVAGGKMRTTGTTIWNSLNTGATNESGFSVLPGGARYSNNGGFCCINSHAFFWSTTVNDYFINVAWNRSLYIDGNVIRNYFHRQDGFSVRCLRD